MKDLLLNMIDTINGDLFASMISILTKDPFTAYSGVYSKIEIIYNIVMSVAMMLIFIYFLIAIVDKMTSENFTWEQLWKQLAMLLAAKYVVEHGLEIMSLMSAMGAELVNLIGTDGVGSFTAGLDGDALITEFEGKFSGIFKVIGQLILLCYLLVPWVFSLIMGICAKVICYTRIIEIYIRACFAPLALSDFFKNGFQGGGWRFLKAFLAVCLQGGVLLVIALMFSTLVDSFLSDVMGGDPVNATNLFQFVGVFFAVGTSAIMLMFRSLGLCKEILGVN